MANTASPYRPVVEITRGPTLESVHFGAAAVVDSAGVSLASCGDPELVTFLRSSAKPFQSIPFLESRASQAIGASPQEIAIACSSHSGTDRHLAWVESLQRKAGLQESLLQCGTHPPLDSETAQRLRIEGLPPTPNRHNCSGKHSGMLATARYLNQPLDTYLDENHVVQRKILAALGSMVDCDEGEILIGTDGCSAPNFAIPLRRAALGYARLADPSGLPPARQAACVEIFAAMTGNPFLVAGPNRFDTDLMEATGGSILSKGGAEGYYAVAIAPARLKGRGVGIAAKIADGDQTTRAGVTLMMHIMERLDVLTDTEINALAQYRPRPIRNHRGLEVGSIRPCFTLEMGR
jgi:L-asparaginase II